MKNSEQYDVPTMSEPTTNFPDVSRYNPHFDKMIYLASPYTHDDKKVREKRYRQARNTAAKLICRGHTVLSPIAYGHPMAQNYPLMRSLTQWKDFDFDVLIHCDALWLLPLDGWEQSEGINLELSAATDHGIPIWKLPKSFYEDIVYAD